MKSLFSYTFTFILLICSFNLQAQPTERTLVKGFNLAGTNSVLIDVKEGNEVIINDWRQDQMRVIMTVSLLNGSDIMLKSLIKVGRYNLDSTEGEGHLKVFLPGLEKQVKLRNDGELIENFKFEIFKPAEVSVKTTADEALAETN